MEKRNKSGQFKKGNKPTHGFDYQNKLWKLRKGKPVGMTGRKHTPETIEKMRKNCGHPVSETTREKIRKSTKGKRLREKNPRWKGGRHKNKSGYISILIDGMYRLEHRYFVEKLLGRELEDYEHIHHLNGIKDDNRLENLKVVINKNHYGEIKCPKCQYDFLIK